MSLCAVGLLEAIKNMEDNDGKIIPHKEDHSFEEVMNMFQEDKPKYHKLRMSDGSILDTKDLIW